MSHLGHRFCLHIGCLAYAKAVTRGYNPSSIPSSLDLGRSARTLECVRRHCSTFLKIQGACIGLRRCTAVARRNPIHISEGGKEMKTHMKAIRFLAVAALVLCSVTALKAQTITGSVNGTVTDPSGAVIPNAKVTAINVDTGVTTETTSNGEGIYNLRFLQIGNYKVTVESTGFAASTVGPFVLETNQNAKIDAKLVLAGQVQKVSVESQF